MPERTVLEWHIKANRFLHTNWNTVVSMQSRQKTRNGEFGRFSKLSLSNNRLPGLQTHAEIVKLMKTKLGDQLLCLDHRDRWELELASETVRCTRGECTSKIMTTWLSAFSEQTYLKYNRGLDLSLSRSLSLYLSLSLSLSLTHTHTHTYRLRHRYCLLSIFLSLFILICCVFVGGKHTPNAH